MVVVIFSAMFKERASTMNDYRGSAMNDYTMVVVIFSATPRRALFNYITTGAFTSVGSLFAPVVKQDSQMNWALLIISKKSTLLKKLHLPAFSYPLTFSTFHLIKVRTVKGGAKWVGGGWMQSRPARGGGGKFLSVMRQFLASNSLAIL